MNEHMGGVGGVKIMGGLGGKQLETDGTVQTNECLLLYRQICFQKFKNSKQLCFLPRWIFLQAPFTRSFGQYYRPDEQSRTEVELAEVTENIKGYNTVS